MQKTHKRWVWAPVMTLVLSSVWLPVSAEEGRVLEDRVAVVNGSVITKADFDREMNRVQRQYSAMGKPISSAQLLEVRKGVLENLVATELLYQESQNEGLEISEAAVDEHLAAVKRQFPDEAAFKDALKRMEISEADIRSEFRRGKAIEQLIDEKVVRKITLSDEETKSYYDNNPDLFTQPEQLRASHILIKVEPEADKSQKDQARKKLEGIQQKLQEGEDFAALAQEFSQGPSSANGGDLGYFGRGQMVKPFEEAAFALKPGEVSDIVESKFGYHLVKVIDRKPETTIAYEDVKDKLEQYLRQQKIQKEIGLYIEQLEAKAKVERFLTEEP
ncbi:MAG: peptidylprolyl isomerase [Candidatus Hydrogenedentota bacterium]|nr:MAG: peptidylprolyl isomerase [Candidatus Hydrogenedentota bacterium]